MTSGLSLDDDCQLRKLYDAIAAVSLEEAHYWDRVILHAVSLGLAMPDLVLVDDRDKREMRLERKSDGAVIARSSRLSLLPDVLPARCDAG